MSRMGLCGVLALALTSGCKDEAASSPPAEVQKQPRDASAADLKAEADLRKSEEEAQAAAAESAQINSLEEKAASIEKVGGKRLACKSLWFRCEADSDEPDKAAKECERDIAKWDVESADRAEHMRVGQKTAYWTRSKCQDFTAQFDKVDKVKAAARRSHYKNHCGGDYAEEGVRVVDDNVEYELVSYSRSGTSVSARVRMTNKGDSPAEGLSLGYSQVVTTDGKEFDSASGGCTPDSLNPGKSITCGLSFSIPKDLEVEGIKVSTLSKWHFAGSLCAKEFVAN